jgi:hypothetical protein
VDRASLLILLLSRPTTARTTWIHLQKVWSKLEKEMPPILLARIAGQTANALPPSAASEIRSFFAAHPLAAGSRVLRQVSEEFALARRLKSHAGRDLEKLLTPPRPG